MTVKDIVEKYLKDNKFDGLYSSFGDCGCQLDDLMPCCSEGIEQCEPGYKTKCNPEECPADGNCNWHISPDKDKEAK